MFLSQNQPFLNFDQFIDVETLRSLRPMLSHFLAKNNRLIKPTMYRKDGFLNDADMGILDYQLAWQENLSGAMDMTDKIKELIECDEFRYYIQFEKTVTVGSFSLVPRYATNYLTKHLAATCVSLPEDQQLDFFYQWLNEQNIFSEIGRVTFFINFQGTKTPCHRDYPGAFQANNDEFIWINLFAEGKKFYILDTATEEKIYVQGHCCWFNTGNYHGSDPVANSCYSLRIDGIFCDQFRKKYLV